MVSAMMVMVFVASFMVSFVASFVVSFVTWRIVCAVSRKPRHGSQHHHHETSNHKDKDSAACALHSTSLLALRRGCSSKTVYTHHFPIWIACTAIRNQKGLAESANLSSRQNSETRVIVRWDSNLSFIPLSNCV